MYLTNEMLKKIEEYLNCRAVKDSQFPCAGPLSGSESIPILLDNKNRLLSIKRLAYYILSCKCCCDGSGSGDIDEDAIKKLIELILSTYKFNGDNIDEDFITNILNKYFEEHPSVGGGEISKEEIKKIVKEVLEEYDFDIDEDKLKEAINNYFKEHPSEGGSIDEERLKQLIKQALDELDFTESINNWIQNNQDTLREIVKPTIDDAVGKAKEEILQELQNYLHNNERVIANALARHEQGITELQVK